MNLTFSVFAVNVILNLSNLPFRGSVEVAKLRAKSLFLSIILVEVLMSLYEAKPIKITRSVVQKISVITP